MTTIEHRWANLNAQRFGSYAEYLVKMRLTLHDLDIYTPEIDDRGIDFVVRTKAGEFLEIQVKAVRSFQYMYIRKSKMTPSPTRYVALGIFKDALPVLYLIPSERWLTPDMAFKNRDYVDKKSEPEWGLDIRESTLPILEMYKFDDMAGRLPFAAPIAVTT